jgi:hypothetical protein
MNEDLKQKHLTAENSVMRAHQIPGHVRKHAKEMQEAFREDMDGAGVGRSNVPSLPDIYLHLVLLGLAKVEAGEKVEFSEVKKPRGAVASRIKFPILTDDSIRSLKERAENGEFKITTGNEISLISVAVRLMELAIDDNSSDQNETAN